jgi:hypothetical protein
MNPADPLPMPENLVHAAASEGYQAWLPAPRFRTTS